jgi:hypothetical protein
MLWGQPNLRRAGRGRPGQCAGGLRRQAGAMECGRRCVVQRRTAGMGAELWDVVSSSNIETCRANADVGVRGGGGVQLGA